MPVLANQRESTIIHHCSKCYSEMVLPAWVSIADADSVVFQCPVCDKEAEIDISDYPKTKLRVVVNEWHDAAYA